MAVRMYSVRKNGLPCASLSTSCKIDPETSGLPSISRAMRSAESRSSRATSRVRLATWRRASSRSLRISSAR